MGRKDRVPGSNERDRSLGSYNTAGFGAGIIRDEPHSELPEEALADGFNIIAHARYLEGRPGTILYGTVPTPTIDGTATFSAIKSGTLVTATTAVFSQAMVSNFVVFPGSPEQHYEIVRYVDEYNVHVDAVGLIPLTSGCRLRGRLNIAKVHSMSRQWVLLFGTELYLRNANMTSQTRVVVVSRDQPSNATSAWATLDKYSGFVFNSNGIYRVELTESPPLAYRINVPVPDVRIADETRTDEDDFNYRILYGAARLTGSAPLRTRLDAVRIETQTGPMAVDADSQRDYADVWTPDPIGPGTEYYQVCRGGYLDNGYERADAWAAISPDYATWRQAINGDEYEFAADMTGVTTMKEVAERLQWALQDFVPSATCKYVVTAQGEYLEFSTGRVAGSTIGYATAAGAGTSVEAELQMRENEGRIVTRQINVPKVIGPLWVPKVANTDPQEYQWHLTHFTLWRTLDVNNTYKQDKKAAAYNDPERYPWEHDLRCGAAFLVCKENNIVTAMVGYFEPQDVGSTLEYDTGDRDTISAYIDSTHVRVGNDYYYNDSGPCPGAAAIGNGRVIRASQTGDIVTRTAGDSFAATDVRKTLIWANGRRSIIRAYTDSDTVQVWDSIDKADQGLTVDPVYRHCCLTATDDTLRSRMSRLLIPNRNWTPLPTCNVGAVAPGYMITVRRGQTELPYCQLPEGKEYLAGYHNVGYQVIRTVTDPVEYLLGLRDSVAILCAGRTWYAPTNSAQIIQIPTIGEVVAVIGGVDILDPAIGCDDFGSITEVGNGLFLMVTAESGVRGLRTFNGYQYGPNLLEDANLGVKRFVRDFQNLDRAGCALYDANVGYLYFGKEKG